MPSPVIVVEGMTERKARDLYKRSKRVARRMFRRERFRMVRAGAGGVTGGERNASVSRVTRRG